MTDREKIRAEVERRLSAHNKVDHLEAQEVGKAWNRGHRGALESVLAFIDSLPEETNPIPSPDEAMKILDEKIALRKENGSWEGTDAENFGR